MTGFGKRCVAIALATCLVSLASPAAADPSGVTQGRNGWLYLDGELRFLAQGEFWGERAAAVSRARKKEWADPLPAILDVARQLDERDIALLLVPVPAKASIHPEGLPESFAGPTRSESAPAFYALLREQGVDVLDLEPAFLALREERAAPLYLRQDSHWADPAIREAARLIAARLRERGHASAQATPTLGTRSRDLAIQGDLAKLVPGPSLPPERVQITEVGRAPDFAPTTPTPDGPVLLLGDSHNLVFHAGGDLHARGAGLPDHLARELGTPVDLVAVRGSGATPARIDLLRRRDALEGKRAVVWVLSAREFTEALQGWRVLPVAR